MASKLDKKQQAFSRQALRRASFRWPARGDALKAARVGRNQYLCNGCKEITTNKEGNLDHIDPVVDPKVGYVDLEEYASRLLIYTGWQWLCKKCHSIKTVTERNIAAKRRKDNPFSGLKAKKKVKKKTKRKKK